MLSLANVKDKIGISTSDNAYSPTEQPIKQQPEDLPLISFSDKNSLFPSTFTMMEEIVSPPQCKNFGSELTLSTKFSLKIARKLKNELRILKSYNIKIAPHQHSKKETESTDISVN